MKRVVVMRAILVLALAAMPTQSAVSEERTPAHQNDRTPARSNEPTAARPSEPAVTHSEELIPGAAPGAPAPSEGTAQPEGNAIVQQPRPYGYVIGDIVTQRVLLRLGRHAFTPEELPAAGRVGVWFERRGARIENDTEGRAWLAVDYQLLNAPQRLALVTIPAWKLQPKDPGEPLQVPEWRMTAGPLTSEQPFARAGLGRLQPDRAPPVIELAPIRQSFMAAGAAAILTLIAWAAWWAWRNWRASSTQPFATASKEMRGLEDASPEAWYALHRAFDRTAGRTTRLETLPALFERAPYLRSMQADIAQFFAQSSARFFAGQPATGTVSVHQLCRELRRLEKRHEA